MASQVELQQQLNATNSAISVLQVELNKYPTGSSEYKQIENQINLLEIQRVNITGEIGNLEIQNNPPDPQAPATTSTTSNNVQNTTPAPVGDTFSPKQDPANGTWTIVNDSTGAVVNTNLTQQNATLLAQDYSLNGQPTTSSTAPLLSADGALTTDVSKIQSDATNARMQAILQQQRKQANDGDWRVRLRLAPGASYLYNAPSPGILAPLSTATGTDGIVFPYTPTINTSYKANYSAYDLTHSNYRGYFYQNSVVDDISIQATFTAQDTSEANYLLAVIHFFRSVTKMFYGQDPNRGTPPPLVFLQGLGQYQFNLHPCVVAQFNYALPADVDYIRANSVNINGTNLLQRRDRQSLPTNIFSAAWERLKNAGATKGAIAIPPPAPTLGTNSPTYVPTKIDISLVLHPVQSRQQVSKQFSLKSFANGDLIKGGFW